MDNVFCEKHLIANCACDQPHKAEKRKLKVKRERSGFWAEPKPTARKLALGIKSGGGTLAFGKDKTLPRPTIGTGQARFLQTVAEFAPRRRGRRPGQKRRDAMPDYIRPAPEVRAWNAMVKADKAIVLAGGRSMLVKVVKRQPDAVTRLGELIQRAMVAANTAE